MQAIIPLAGKGTRVRPHTHSRPKPLLQVANRPVLEYLVDQLVELGVSELVCITGHLASQIEEYLDGEYPALDKRYIEQVEQRGTADAIRLAEPFVNGPVLIVFVDTIFEADLSIIQARPQDDGIIWAKEVEDYQRFGVIVTDDRGYMERIVEKPTEPVSKLANIGVYYVRDYELMFEGIAKVMADEPNLGEYFLTDAFQYMIERGSRIFTAEVAGWWDCGKPETLLSTNREMLRRFGVPDAASVSSGEAVLNEPVGIGANVTLERSVLGPNVSVGDGSVIRGSRLRDCIVGANATIEDCELRESIVGEHTTLRGIVGSVSVGDHSQVAVGTEE
jgi:glucose-1-phosphate thymidylyltransferase